MNTDNIDTLNAFLSFRLAEEVFAINVAKVLEILEVPPITKVPRSPDYMRGVINLRGNVLPVVDTRLKFGLAQAPDTVNTCIIVMDIEIDGEDLKIGALVDAVQEVLEISESQIKPPPSIGHKYKSGFIRGMTKIEEHFLMILDVDKVFSTEEAILLNEHSQEDETNNNES